MTRVDGRHHPGLTVWLTGLPSAGKSTIARGLERRLLDEGYRVEILDGDALRTHLCRDLGFSREDRDENVRRVGFVAQLLARNGVIAICALVSPYRKARDEVRAMHEGRFLEVHVSAPPDVCAERDVKGLYARARDGHVAAMTGYDDPYEPPLSAEVVLPTHRLTLDESVEAVLGAVQELLRRPGEPGRPVQQLSPPRSPA